MSWYYWPAVWSYQMLFVLVAAALSESFAFTLPRFTVSLAYPLAMSAVIIGGPASAGIVAAVSSGVTRTPALDAQRQAFDSTFPSRFCSPVSGLGVHQAGWADLAGGEYRSSVRLRGLPCGAVGYGGCCDPGADR